MTSSARIDDLQRKYEENPRRYFAPLASELRRAGEAGRAVSLCEAGLRADPGHLSGHVVLAQALTDLGDRDGAEQAFGRAVELDPENVIALRSLGDLTRDRGDVPTARTWYQRALETDPRDPELATRLATLDAAPAAWAESRARIAAEPAQPVPPESASLPVAEPTLPDPVPADGGIDQSQLREFQAEREAQEFTAGFFAALLDAQRAETEPPASAAARPIADDRIAVDSAIGEVLARPSDARDGHGDAAESVDVEHGPPSLPETSAERTEPDEPMDAGRPPDVTIAEDRLDVLPGEREYLDDLMELDGELASDVYEDEAAAAEWEALPELGTAPDAGELEPDGTFDQPTDAAVEAGAGRPEQVEPPVEEPSVDEVPVEEPPPDEPTVDEPLIEEVSARAPDDESAPDVAGGDDEIEVAASDEEFSVADEPASVGGEAPQLSFVTATMGTLLLQQGFRNDALQIFRQLSAQKPDDADLRARVEELEAELAAPADAGSGMTVSDWLRTLTEARPSPAPAEVAQPAAGAAERREESESIGATSTGSAEWVEAMPEAASAAPVADADRDEAPTTPTVVAGPEWVEATPEESTPETMTPETAVADVDAPGASPPLDPVGDGSAAAGWAEPPAEDGSGMRDPGSTATANDEPATAAPAETDLLAGAAAAAASAVTWEATESPTASDELFFGDDPLDWGQVAAAAPATGPEPEPVVEPPKS
ncbi:MAG: tetratricopeptide repeat protein, partial [Gemmatimonadaceae bacterium]